MMRTKWAPLLLAGGLCLSLAGCTHGDNTAAPQGSAQGTSKASASASASPSTPPVTTTPSKGSYGNNPQAPTDDHASPYPSLAWDDSARRDAKDTATKVMELFARPDVESTTWHKDINPYLTEEARADHASFDPSYLDITGISKGAVKLAAGGSAQRATVEVPTRPKDELYKVDVVRMPDGSWAVDGITPGDLGQQ